MLYPHLPGRSRSIITETAPFRTNSGNGSVSVSRVRSEDAPIAPPSGSWVLEPAPGVYGSCPAWTSRGAWLSAVEAFLVSDEGKTFRQTHRYRVKVSTLLKVAALDSEKADHGNGRNVATSNDSVARKLELSAKTIQRARAVMTEAGFYRTVVTGKVLSATERELAKRAHGRFQRVAASTRALTMSKETAMKNVHQPIRKKVRSLKKVLNTPQANAASRGKAVNERNRTRRGTSRRIFIPDSAELVSFARDLKARVPWLRHSTTSAVASVVRRSGWNAKELSVGDWMALHERRNVALGLDSPAAENVRHPLGLLHQQLRVLARLAKETGYESERSRRERRNREDEVRALQQKQETEEALRIRRELEDPAVQAEIAQILAEMKAKYPPVRKRR